MHEQVPKWGRVKKKPASETSLLSLLHVPFLTCFTFTIIILCLLHLEACLQA